MGDQRIVAIAHFLPWLCKLSPTESNQNRWEFEARNSHISLFSGLLSLAEDYTCIYVGWVGQCFQSDGTTPLPEEELTEERRNSLRQQLREEKNAVPVFLPEDVAAGHYEGFCKTVLWALFHYNVWNNISDGSTERDYYDFYVKANEKYAVETLKIYQPGDLVWIHDYHLCMLPSLLRKEFPESIIGFFFHAPFPSSELFRCLPQRKELISSILRSDVVGFQNFSYGRHFISTCTRVLGLESTPKGVDYNGYTVSVECFPIGIDVDAVELRRKRISKVEELKTMFSGKKIIIGRDKTEQSTGAIHKLHAFEKFLIAYPEWQGKVVFIEITSPLRRGEAKLDPKVTEFMAKINGKFGSLDYTPVLHYYKKMEDDNFLSLLSVADVGLITSVRDGVNSAAYEFVICQKDNCGPLILSEFTGTASSLSGAILVNPWDFMNVAHTIQEALTMHKDERLMRQKQLLNNVTRNDAQYWARSFVNHLKIIQSNQSITETPFLDREIVGAAYQSSQKRLILLDYDGTLSPIVQVPSQANPSKSMLSMLDRLVSDPKNAVFIVSGRDQKTLDNWVGHLKIGLSAEHGCFIKYPGMDWISLTEGMDLSWQSEVLKIFDYYTERTPGSFTEMKRIAITWHYRQADHEYGTFQAKECQHHLEESVISKLPVEVIVGKKNLEVRPKSLNKGEIVKKLVLDKELGEWDFILCAGDDRTDEDMFKVLKTLIGASCPDLAASKTFSVAIGNARKQTSACWHISSPQLLVKALNDLMPEYPN